MAAGITALLGTHLLTYTKGESAGRDKAEVAYARALKQASDRAEAQSAAIARMAGEQLLAEQQRDTTHKEIIRESVQIIDRPVYRSTCIDADGLRLLDQLAANANGNHSAPSADTAAAAATVTTQPEG